MTKKRLWTVCSALVISICSFAQTTFTGKVVDTKEKPLAAVSVLAENQKGNTLSFTKTAKDGSFTLNNKGDSVTSIVFRRMGYETVTYPLTAYTNGQKVIMAEKGIDLKEVKVTAGRIRKEGDTLTYSVAAFKQKQDRSIADVINKMPGMKVNDDGSISYQGKNINKFYVEGMDMMGGKYAQVSENLSADKVKNVQVYENHQPVKALKNIEFSEQAALNIQLTDDAKNIWQANISAATGATLQGQTDWLYETKLMAMMFGKRKQSLSMYKNNNTGKDIQHEVRSLSFDDLFIQNSGGMLSNLSVSAPDLNSERYTFNDSHLFATNWLFKVGKDNDLRLQADYLFDKSDMNSYTETSYTDVGDAMLVTEDTKAKAYRSEYTGEMSYSQNTNSTYIKNLLKGSINFNRSWGYTDLMGQKTMERVSPRERFISDNMKIIQSIGHGNNVSINAKFSYSYNPGTLLLTDDSTEELNTSNLSWGVNTSFQHKLFGTYLSYNVGVDYNKDDIELQNPLTDGVQKDEYSYYNFFISPSWSYKKRKIETRIGANIRAMTRKYNDQGKDNLFITTMANVNYDIFSDLTMSASWSFMSMPEGLSSFTNLPIYNSYISMRQGRGLLNEYYTNSLSTSLKFDDIMTGLFANLSLSYSHNSGMLLYKSELTESGVYLQKATDAKNNTESWGVDGGIGKSFSWAKMNIRLDGAYSKSSYHLLMNNDVVPYQMRSASFDYSMSLRPLPLLSIEENSTFSWNKQVSRAEGGVSGDPLCSWYHKLKMFVLPGNWQIEFDNEIYHSNDESVSFNYFADFAVSYRTKPYEIGLWMNNILGREYYKRKVVANNYNTYTICKLRPREVLLKVLFSL